jgi:uncharacterized membrane protein YczE
MSGFKFIYKRYLYYLLGMNILVLGITCNTLSDLGVGAFSTLPYAVSFLTFLTFGQANIVFYLIFVCIQMILERKISMKFILEIPLSFAFGWLTDLYDFIIPTLSLSLYLRVICFIMTMFITAMGVFLSVKTNLILTPTDGIVKTISEVFSFPFSIVKNTFDITLVFVTIILCLINHTHFYGLGIGTILTALFIGRIINIYEKKIQLSF